MKTDGRLRRPQLVPTALGRASAPEQSYWSKRAEVHEDMALDDVVFSVANRRFPTRYVRSHLKLGATVHVTVGADGVPTDFSPTQAPDSKPYYVMWIAPSEWYVPLRAVAEVEPSLIARVEAAVQSRLEPSTVDRALAILATKIRPSQMYKTDTGRQSRLYAVTCVVDRLDLCQRLDALEIGTALFSHWQGLCAYLYLTCFDVLGQNEDWLTFDKWLAASRTADERKAVLDRAGAGADPVLVAKKLHEAYNETYGVKAAFMNFLRDVLPPASRERLLASINIYTLKNPPDLSEITTSDDEADKDKERYLFETRNGYTHRAQYVGGIHPEVFRATSPAWDTREQVIKANEWTTYSSLGWPGPLENAVRDGLAQLLRRVADPDL